MVKFLYATGVVQISQTSTKGILNVTYNNQT